MTGVRPRFSMTRLAVANCIQTMRAACDGRREACHIEAAWGVLAVLQSALQTWRQARVQCAAAVRGLAIAAVGRTLALAGEDESGVRRPLQGGDRQLGCRSTLATAVSRCSKPQPAVGQFKTGYGRSGSGDESQREPRPEFEAVGPWLSAMPRNLTRI